MIFSIMYAYGNHWHHNNISTEIDSNLSYNLNVSIFNSKLWKHAFSHVFDFHVFFIRIISTTDVDYP